MPSIETLVILTLALCPYRPDPLPELIIMPSDGFEFTLAILAKKKYGGFEALYEKGTIQGVYDAATNTVILNADHANDRVLCHEWRHAADPDWRHQ